MKPAIALFLACLGLVACGGKATGSDRETDAGAAGDSASNADAHDAGLADGPPVACAMPITAGKTDAGCDLDLTRQCSDGTSYEAYCSCPAATCTCTVTTAMGSMSSNVPYTGCAGCDYDTALLACGFFQ
jgi:hypothetical protein